MTDGVNMGLEGLVVAETRLSHVDGQAGRLVIAGQDLADLVRGETFLGVAARLMAAAGAAWPQDPDALAAAQTAVFGRIGPFLAAARGLSPVAALRLGLAMQETDDPVPLLAAGPVLLAAHLRARQGLAPVAPDPSASLAAGFLAMLNPDQDAALRQSLARGLDVYWMTVSDHGLNASTFTARVIASTQAGTMAAVVGALGALEGPLHGGAPGPVLDMLDAIATPAAAGPWLRAALARGERLMGFGHRIYRVRDPRADVLKAALRDLPPSPRLALAEVVEAEARTALAAHRPDRPLETNVEYYTALVLEAVGLPRDAFTAAFGLGRMAGWLAHCAEQRRTGRLIRPQSRYIGPMPDGQAAA